MSRLVFNLWRKSIMSICICKSFLLDGFLWYSHLSRSRNESIFQVFFRHVPRKPELQFWQTNQSYPETIVAVQWQLSSWQKIPQKSWLCFNATETAGGYQSRDKEYWPKVSTFKTMHLSTALTLPKLKNGPEATSFLIHLIFLISHHLAWLSMKSLWRTIECGNDF